jgi:hypothetical protein
MNKKILLLNLSIAFFIGCNNVSQNENFYKLGEKSISSKFVPPSGLYVLRDVHGNPWLFINVLIKDGNVKFQTGETPSGLIDENESQIDVDSSTINLSKFHIEYKNDVIEAFGSMYFGEEKTFIFKRENSDIRTEANFESKDSKKENGVSIGARIKELFVLVFHKKENINSNNLDTLKMFDNIIYERGESVGKLITVDFIKKSNQSGRVFIIPNDKMWTPLFFEYKDLGDNLSLTIPEILTNQNKNSRIGREYYYMHIYDDKSTNTWWEKESGFYFPEQEDFKSIKFSTRNRKAISGRNAIYVDGYEKNVKYIFYFFEESIRDK